ncbi:MAG: glycosyltransferase family 4 protein [Gammaproteobacteria bacterium]|nr:glycosyltransferase family 4 protein [Gammaproteobacteria bacterium]
MKKKYAFIKIRSRHTIVDQIIRILKHTFPEYELDVIDVKPLLKRNIHIALINLFHMVANYGVREIFQSKSAFYNRFFGTPYLYHHLHRLLNTRSKSGYLFSIQDCSLFNGKLAGIPHFVYTDHTVLANKNYPEYDEKSDLLSKSWINLERDIYGDADIVFTRSMIVRESVVQDYSCDVKKVHCIYYAPFVEEGERESSLNKYASKNILFVGLEWERKGGPLLVKAFEQVVKVEPDATLTIVGCSPDIVLPNVEIVGPVKSEKLCEYYEKSAVFCLPTRREPFGIVFLEAMSYSLPVLGTNIGALPEFIIDGDNGYLVGIDDVNGLARLLIGLISDPAKCERMGRRGYDIYREKFTLEAVSSSLKRYITPFIRA